MSEPVTLPGSNHGAESLLAGQVKSDPPGADAITRNSFVTTYLKWGTSGIENRLPITVLELRSSA